ncbi:MAG: MFS transporter [Firmicutes bacterium]|nr:MFS transporter [Bacillota bacterium]
MSKLKYILTLIALGVCGGTIYIIPYIRYSFYTQLTEAMNVTNAQLASLTSMYALVAIILFIPGGVMADRFNAKKLIMFSLIGTTLLTVVFALNMSYTVANIVWIGLAVTTGTTFWPGFVKFLNALGDAESSGRTFGYYYALNGISAAIVNTITLWVLNKFGLTAGILTIAASTGIAAVLIFIFIDNKQQEAVKDVKTAEADKFKFSDLGVVIKSPATYVLGIASFCTYALYSNTSYFTPYLVDVLGVDPSTSSIFSIIRTYVFMLLAPIGGIMADKVLKATSKWLMITLGLIAAFYIVIIMLPSTISPTFASWFTLIPAAIAMSMYGVRFSIIRELHIKPQIVGTVMGVASMISWATDFILPPLFGTLLDKNGNAGYTTIFIILTVIGVVGVAISYAALLMDKKHKKAA